MRNDVDDAASLSLCLQRTGAKEKRSIVSPIRHLQTRQGCRAAETAAECGGLHRKFCDCGIRFGKLALRGRVLYKVSTIHRLSVCVCGDARVATQVLHLLQTLCADKFLLRRAAGRNTDEGIECRGTSHLEDLHLSRCLSLSLPIWHLFVFFFKYIYKFSTPSTPVISYRCQGPLRCRPPKQT